MTLTVFLMMWLINETKQSFGSIIQTNVVNRHRNPINMINLTIGPRQANLVLIAYGSSESSGEPAHPRSLARTSAARSYKQ